MASVSASGLARAVADGATTITAAVGGASDSAAVEVHQELAQVIVSPAMVDLEVGDTLRLIAEAQDANGNPLGTAGFVWMSANAYVATVDSTGLVRARVRGEATITARIGALADTADLTVSLPHIPPNFAVDEGTSHSLQFGGRYVSHRDLGGEYVIALAYADLNNDGRTDIFYAPVSWTTDRVPRRCTSPTAWAVLTSPPGFLASTLPVVCTRARCSRATSTGTEGQTSSCWTMDMTRNRSRRTPICPAVI